MPRVAASCAVRGFGLLPDAPLSYPIFDYTALKLVHISAVGASLLGFVARGVGMLRGDAWVRGRLTRVLPHVIDTTLLVSALGMLWVLQLSPWGLAWLRAKILGLLCYILLGSVALRLRLGRLPPTPPGVRLASWLAALSAFGYIVSVALTKDPRGLFFPMR